MPRQQLAQRSVSVLLAAACCWLLCMEQASAQNSLFASGTTVATQDIMQIMNTLSSQSKPATSLAYRAAGTGAALDEFSTYFSSNSSTSRSSPLVVSGFPVASANYSSGMLQVPVALLKVSVWHTVPASSYTGSINLTSCVLAYIFARVITTWDHVDIKDLNPGLSVPFNTPITVIGRSDVSPTTMSFTNYLQSACAPKTSPWTLGSSRKQSSWPLGTVVVTDTETLARKLWAADPAYVPYAISYADYALGARYHAEYNATFTEVALRLPNNTWSTAAAADNSLVSASLSPSPSPTYPAITSNWDAPPYTTRFIAPASPGAWPVTVPLMLITAADASALGAQGQLLAAFLAYCLSDAGQAAFAANFHVALRGDARADLQAQLGAALRLSNATPAWAFERRGAVLAGGGGGDFVFSEYRSSYLTAHTAAGDVFAAQIASLAARAATLESLSVLAAADRAAAAVDRMRINATVIDIASAEHTAKAANNIAIAGVVLAVVLAVVALTVAVVYIVRTKKLDQKYSKYLPLGVKARFDETPENI